jgi:hypothetical protein
MLPEAVTELTGVGVVAMAVLLQAPPLELARISVWAGLLSVLLLVGKGF